MEHQGSLASPLGTWVALSNDGIIGTFIKDLLLPLAKLAGWAGDLASLAKCSHISAKLG